MPTIGIMHSGSERENAKQIEAFLKSLELSGYANGFNDITILPPCFAEGDRSRLLNCARDLVDRQRVDFLVAAGGSASAEAAQAVTNGSATPVVFTSVADPARPADNMTGICARTSELDATRLSLLHELRPDSRTIAAITNSSRPKFSDQWSALSAAATALGVGLQPYE